MAKQMPHHAGRSGFHPADGFQDVSRPRRSGDRSGKRVWRNFPRFDNWKADVNFYILADEITEDVFDEALRQSGAFVGIGRFRPEKGGFYGRFEVADIKWH
jgi:hypothetical protein